MLRIIKMLILINFLIYIFILIKKSNKNYNKLKINSLKIKIVQFKVKNKKKINNSNFLKIIELFKVRYFYKTKNENIISLKKIIENKISYFKKQYIRDYDPNTIDFFKLQKSIKASPIIKKVNIEKSLKGNIYVYAYIRAPIARIIDKKGNSIYIDSKGYLFFTSMNYQFNILTLYFDKLKIKNDYIVYNDYNIKLLDFLNFIDENKFLKSQITHLQIQNDGFINIFTQICKQRIEFGHPVNIMGKFKKFFILYKNILPKSGWNKYKRVNLEYNKQIICE